MNRNVLLLVILLVCRSAAAQFITQGPVIGAVTSSSARMYLRSESPSEFVIEMLAVHDEIDTHQFEGRSRENLDNSVIIDMDGLLPDTRYFCKVYVNGVLDSITGDFRTFPKEGAKGEYTFVTGSCQETENMKVFDVMPKHDPFFLLHTGDYIYPDYQICPDYSADYETVAYSYRKRYDEKVMKGMLRYIPIDYIYDDNDYVGGGGGRYNKEQKVNYRLKYRHRESKLITLSEYFSEAELAQFLYFLSFLPNKVLRPKGR